MVNHCIYCNYLHVLNSFIFAYLRTASLPVWRRQNNFNEL